jgi:hypothetical protein
VKLVVVVYEAGVDDSVTELLGKLGVSGWTKLEGATGMGHKGLRLGTPIWPGTNNVLLVAMDEQGLLPFLDALEDLKREYRKPPAVFAFVVPVEAVR